MKLEDPDRDWTVATAEELTKLVEVRRYGLRYVAPTREVALRLSLPREPEVRGTPFGDKVFGLKEDALRAAEAIIPGVVDSGIVRARKLTRASFTFGEAPGELAEWAHDELYFNTALFLHYLFNVLGYTYADEERVAERHLQMLRGR